MNIKILFLVLISSLTACAQQFDHSLFTEILKDNNNSGYVDYKSLQSDKRLDEYLENLSKFIPQGLESEKEKMAFWINAYNAYTIKAIVDNYPIESINDLHAGGRILGHILSTTVWDDDFVIVNGKEYSLNDIEHKILRKKFKEPRIHFAIVCASISCPQLRYESFNANNLDDQLESQAKRFFNDKSKNRFDGSKKIAYISKILDWFSEDFGDSNENVLLFISEFLEEPIRSNIKNNTADWSVEYLDYNWGLNDYK